MTQPILYSFEVTAALPSVTWRNDYNLDCPLLKFPMDGAKLCPEIVLLYGHDADITLKWSASAGAGFYVLQLCGDSSFSGPSLTGIKVVGTNQYTLKYLEHLRMGTDVYWRVAACDGSGGSSVFSRSNKFTIECPKSDGSIDYDVNGSDYALVSSGQVCDKTGVDIKIVGPANVRLTDSERVFALSLNYDCKSLDDNAISVDSVIWEIKQSSGNPATITDASDYFCKLDIDATDPEIIELKATVVFNVASGPTYECHESVRVMIEGAAVGGGGSMYLIEITDADCATQSAIAVVIQTPCTGSTVSVGDELEVFDRSGCNIQGEESLLIGLKGWVQKMSKGSGSTDSYEDNCEWVIVNLCCNGFSC